MPLLLDQHSPHNALKSSGTSPNFLITLASLKSPVAGSPVRLNATAPTWPSLRDSASGGVFAFLFDARSRSVKLDELVDPQGF
jgi:hypothetical protein